MISEEEIHMISLKRSSLLLFGLLLTVFFAACSNPLSGNTTTGNTTTTNTTTTKTTSSYGKTSSMTSTTPMAKPTAVAQKNNNMGTQTTMGNNGNMGMQGNNNALIHTTMVKLNGKMITVLTNAKGMILYYKLNDPRPASACTGACATAWPPVLANTMNMMMISSSMQLPHKLTVYKTANGSQIEYDGHPLYTYAGDMTPGMFTGRGMGNVWYLVSLGL
jgi:predicted lipoprotein with Yx(FWY)xxD motif